MENFVAEKEKLLRAHEENITALKHRHWEEEVQMEKNFDEQLSKLMEKYSPSQSETKAPSNDPQRLALASIGILVMREYASLTRPPRASRSTTQAYCSAFGFIPWIFSIE
ncbi:hypothetical protein Ahy_A08g041042 [Arachis hypogaea]|uniref:Uncharacterized protein n=1 Tax=Arachis hypogaea TaxID=3818 RepID=A0A445C1F8_ARAHY|nr:hypothetical protein Ahy_A08g041042 [Arachis hypogaea]